jgi:hypothetical protein
VANEKDRWRLKTVQSRQRQIGAELERLWSEVVEEPIPDEMLELLKKLDEKNRRKPDA